MKEKLIEALVYLRSLFEDEPGVLSMRRVGFFVALTAVLFVVIAKPESITDSVVGALREILLVVAFVYGAPRTAESITDAINAIKELRSK